MIKGIPIRGRAATMNIDSLISQIKSMETQLAIVRAQLEKLRPAAPPKTFADLCGLWEGKSSSTEEDIEAVKYHFEWEGEEIR
jgi:hypothetical protein